jgi:hypothetical protein
VVHEIAGDQRRLALRADQYADMPRRVADRWHEADLVRHPVVGLDQIGEAGIMHRLYRVGEYRRHVVALVLLPPMRELDPPHQVARLRKGRHPFAFDQHRVPADMVDMQMRAQHRVDRLARIAGGGKVGEERALQIVPGWDTAALLVVAEAGIDDNAALRRLDDERMDAHLQPAAFIGKMRLKPFDRQDLLIGRLRQDEPAAAGDLQLDDLGHRDLADPPFLHCPSPPARAQKLSGEA